jgi:hypothetical protein
MARSRWNGEQLRLVTRRLWHNVAESRGDGEPRLPFDERPEGLFEFLNRFGKEIGKHL